MPAAAAAWLLRENRKHIHCRRSRTSSKIKQGWRNRTNKHTANSTSRQSTDGTQTPNQTKPNANARACTNEFNWEHSNKQNWKTKPRPEQLQILATAASTLIAVLLARRCRQVENDWILLQNSAENHPL
jgi:hypothetical protein